MSHAFTGEKYADPIAQLKFDNNLTADIISSLKAAQEAGKAKLGQGLYNALIMPKTLSDWPTTIDEYLLFLSAFLVWRPIEETGSQWSNNYSGAAGGSQEIYDRLCFFYFLINQPLDNPLTVQKGETLQQNAVFNTFINNYSKSWGMFLSTTASFDSSTEIQEFMDNSPLYSVIDSMESPDNTTPPYEPVGGMWKTFNQFFARALRPGLRPIATPSGANEVLITRPADCTFRAQYSIDGQGQIVTPDGKPIVIKGTHTFATVSELLQTDTSNDYNKLFANGTFVHYFLAPYSYHRFHTPVTGTVIDQRVVTGIAYLAVEIDETEKQFNAPDDSEDGYEFQQARGFIVIDTSQNDGPDIGLVAVAPIGMAQVSSVVLADANGQPLESDTPVAQGDQFGYFYFGGSDIIVLIQQSSEVKGTVAINTETNDPSDFNPDTQPHYTPDYYSYGTEIISVIKT